MVNLKMTVSICLVLYYVHYVLDDLVVSLF